MGAKTKRGPGLEFIEPGLYRVIVRIRANGKIVEKREIVAGTKEQAKDRRQQIKREIRGDKSACSLTSKGMSIFSDLLEIYKSKKTGLSAAHLSKIAFVERKIGSFPIQGFADRFEGYLNFYRQSPITFERSYGKVVLNKKPGPSAINRIVEIVRAAFNVCIELGYLNENPIAKARFPKLKEKPRDRYLTFNERQRLLNVVEQHAPHIYPLLRYALLVPSRISELLGLHRENFDMITNTLYIPDSKAGIPIYKPIPAEMLEYFRHGIPNGCPWLFYRQDESGEYRQLKTIQRTFRTCLRMAKIVDFKFHDTRHIAATDLYSAGNSERAIMDIAGWKTPMLSTYRHKDSLQSAMRIHFCKPQCEDAVKTREAAGM